MPLLGLAPLVGDAEADDAEPVVGGVQVPYPAQYVGVDEESVVVQLDHDVDVAEGAQLRESHVPATRTAQVLVELDRRDLAGQPQPLGELGQRAAVAHDDDPGGGEILLGHGLEQRVDLGGAVPHGHHGDSDPRFRHTLPSPLTGCDYRRDASGSR